MNHAIEKTNAQPAGLVQANEPRRKIVVVGGVQVKFGLQVTQLGEMISKKKLAVMAVTFNHSLAANLGVGFLWQQ